MTEQIFKLGQILHFYRDFMITSHLLHIADILKLL